MIEDIITKGVDAVCVVPTEANALGPVLQKARDAGIVVITHESPGQAG
jgi:simple sugar transport system substrate-binding protein